MDSLFGMQLFPPLQIGFTNGWLLFVLFCAVELLLVLSYPKERRGRLFEYDHSNWTKTHRISLVVGKSFSLLMIVLLLFTPLALGTPAFYIGITIYLVGLMGFVVALLNFRNTPLDQPITRGIYRISRNPQVLTIFIVMTGISLAMGSWTALAVGIASSVFGRARIIEEERYCLQRYGDGYREYLERVPRYVLLKTRITDRAGGAAPKDAG
jgi:protein-S-isoprenylcysteine O-methyltransferase Ste14